MAVFDFLVRKEGFPRKGEMVEGQMVWVRLKRLEAEQSAWDLVEFTGEWDEGPQTVGDTGQWLGA